MDNMRALLVGGSADDAVRLGRRLAPAALVICFATDRATGEALKRSVRSSAPDARVSVMIGDPWLLVHKVAGPFDLIVVPPSAGGAQARARLRRLLREGGDLDG